MQSEGLAYYSSSHDADEGGNQTPSEGLAYS